MLSTATADKQTPRDIRGAFSRQKLKHVGSVGAAVQAAPRSESERVDAHEARLRMAYPEFPKYMGWKKCETEAGQDDGADRLEAMLVIAVADDLLSNEQTKRVKDGHEGTATAPEFHELLLSVCWMW